MSPKKQDDKKLEKKQKLVKVKMITNFCGAEVLNAGEVYELEEKLAQSLAKTHDAIIV